MDNISESVIDKMKTDWIKENKPIHLPFTDRSFTKYVEEELNRLYKAERE